MTDLRPSLLRQRATADSSRVAMVELFFDLVFVFAVTQLSHTLLEHLTVRGALQTLLLFLAVWWLWIFTSWVTNWLDPDRPPVRVMLFALMLGGLLLSSSIPQAFADRGVLFGVVFATMQVGRTVFVAVVTRGRHRVLHENFVRIALWLAASGVCWVMGGLADGPARVAWWVAAVAIEYLAPALYFYVPRLGRSNTTDWDVDGHHLAERCALFVIIALGESILVTGATFAGQAWSAPTFMAFGVAFLGSVAMWWIYFDTGAERASHRISHSDDPGRQARLAYTYLHLLIVAGIIVCAVADELTLAHPDHFRGSGKAEIVAMIGGPMLYLLGVALFKWVCNDRRTPPLSHCAGVALLGALFPFAFAHLLSPLAIGAATTLVLVIVATWETIALRRGR
ncbi:low temperature requirement protein A [Lysobacter auxotrophicus]|uniref:Low temperature requirement protein A n=1 Tax=Lysobacter auxotrophicus TaxID=2992573 RepID=A0ABN6UK26_9GAMM|nr:low temperature requirement protein A [Lysobacter auxotrophicus]BDU16591.1 low temperature requirement protein A [Lysobacter auxotrophicus]